MASLRKINGNYYAYFYDSSRDPKRDPKRKSYPLRVSLKSAAEKLKHRLESEYAEGKFDPWNPSRDDRERLSLEEAVSRFIKTKAHLRERTVQAYRNLLGHWKRDHVPAGLLLSDLRAEHLHSFVWGQDGLARATRRKRYRYLRTFCGWATDEGHVEDSPLEGVG